MGTSIAELSALSGMSAMSLDSDGASSGTSSSGAFGVYAQANVYYSPAGLPSAVHAHQDAQSVFVVQCEGRKSWELLEPPQRWRLRYNQRGKAGDVAPESELMRPIASYTLSPGDVLFVPRGMYHRTSTQAHEGSRA